MIDDPKPKTPPPPDWRAAAQAAYEASRDYWISAALARAGLPSWRTAGAPPLLYDFVSPHLVRVTVDGNVFRVTRGLFGAREGMFGPHVMLERPCSVCGLGCFPSGWIDAPAQLWERLEHFRPRHWNCKPPPE